MRILGVNIKPQVRRMVSSSPVLNFIAKGYMGIIHLKSYQVFFSHLKPVSLSKKNIQEYNRNRPVHNYKYICHAPFANMYFGFEGKIRACCYNVSHQLGKYPEASIMEAWNGNAAQELRDKIKHYDLTAGCYCCQVQLVEKAFYTVLARNYDDLPVSSDFPVSMEFELSNKCNLECIMCSETYSSAISAKREMTVKDKVYDEHFIQQLRIFIPHLKKTKFLGGEPFLIPIYYKIWEVITELNPACEIIVQTNGTILNERIKNLLNRGNFSISISIDSLDKVNFEQIRKNADFDKVFTNMLYFINFCKQNNRYIGIACCFMKQNWQDIPDLVRYFSHKQVPVTFNRVWEPAKCSVWHSPPDLIRKIMVFYKKQSFNTRTAIEKRNVDAFDDLIHQLDEWYKNEKVKLERDVDYDNTPVETLKEIVETHIFNNETANNITTEKKKQIVLKFKNALHSIDDTNKLRQLLIQTLDIPGEILIRELMNNTESRIAQQINDLFDGKNNN